MSNLINSSTDQATLDHIELLTEQAKSEPSWRDAFRCAGPAARTLDDWVMKPVEGVVFYSGLVYQYLATESGMYDSNHFTERTSAASARARTAMVRLDGEVRDNTYIYMWRPNLETTPVGGAFFAVRDPLVRFINWSQTEVKAD